MAISSLLTTRIATRFRAAFPVSVNYGLSDLRGDIFGGITAGAVALPVAMGYGVMSGLGAVAGLYGAITVGLFASLFGGTRGATYGPNILITITMAIVVAEYADSIEQAATTAVLAGLIQIIFGILGLGRYASYIPFSLTSGFFTAFGILLVVKQSVLALGASPAAGSVVDTVRSLPDVAATVNYHALLLTVICLALHIAWRGRLMRISPPQFIVLAVGVVAGVLWFGDAPTLGDIPTGLPGFDFSAMDLNFFLHVLQPAFIMALLASVATFITALRLDTITGSQHRPNREMMGQGIGNIATGFTGGLVGSIGPGTLINAYSGGRSPVAGLTVVAILLAVLLFLGPVAERIPFAVLAAILIMNGWSIIDRRFLTRIHKVPRSYAIVMLLTCILVLFVDIVSAIVVGLVIAALTASRRLEGLESSSLVSVPLLDRAILRDEDLSDDSDPFQAQTGLVVLPDRITVASARQLSRILRPDIRGHQFVIFDMSRTVYVDDSAAAIISELIAIVMARRSTTIIIAGMTKDVSDTLNSMGLLDRVPSGNFASDQDAAKELIRPRLLELEQAR